jgi:hypothetical protein
MRSARWWVWAAVIALAVGPGPARAATVLDSGRFHVYLGKEALGTEEFSYETGGDSLVVHAFMVETPRGVATTDTLFKDMALVANVDDYSLRAYNSTQRFLGETLTRGLDMRDTSYVAFTQVGESGLGESRVRPPGRLFVLDQQVYVLYDFICRNLYGRPFTKRPVQLLWLGQRGQQDSVGEATATDLGRETIRWGSRPVQARKLSVADANMEFFVWISPEGHMLRMTQPAYDLRVEREPPPVKRKARPSDG